MITLIGFFLALIGIVFLRKKVVVDNEDEPRTFSIRAVIFPVHWFIRDTLFRASKSNGATFVAWFLFGWMLLFFAVPFLLFDEQLGIEVAIYIAIGWAIWCFPQKAILSDGELGKAHFFGLSSLKSGHLLNKNGIVLGKKENRLIAKKSDAEGNVAIFGGAGTGKTAGNLIPTLLTYQGNAFVVDIKPELLVKTGHLHANKKVLSFIEPTLAYDPLANLETYTDVIDLAKTVIPISPEMKEPYFKESAQNILASACWEFKEEKSFSEIAEFLTANPADKIINQLASSEKSETKILINAVAGIKSEQLASLMNELRNTLVIFATDPVLKTLTSHKEKSIRPQDIEENWVYVVLPESKLQVYKPFLSLIVSQFTRYLTQRPEKSD
ncbi:type IV secretory system conjugative DNA transfer family protein, partial [Tetragenococcus koreensis]